jgi:hypothetical protein
MPLLPQRPRAILNKEQAIEIFQIKLDADTRKSPCPPSVRVAVLFGISEKTVRDIWKGRSWARETYHFDQARQVPIKEGRAKPARMSVDSRPTSAPLHINQVPKSQTKRQNFKLCSFLATSITPINALSIVCSDQHQQYRTTSLQYDGVFDSVDRQLHEWTKGTSTPLKLIDPFQLDWAAAAEGMQDLP